MCSTINDLKTPQDNDCYHQAAPFCVMVSQYLSAMEQAPHLYAKELDKDFKLLTKFSNTIIAGREMEKDYGMKLSLGIGATANRTVARTLPYEQLRHRQI